MGDGGWLTGMVLGRVYPHTSPAQLDGGFDWYVIKLHDTVSDRVLIWGMSHMELLIPVEVIARSDHYPSGYDGKDPYWALFRDEESAQKFEEQFLPPLPPESDDREFSDGT